MKINYVLMFKYAVALFIINISSSLFAADSGNEINRNVPLLPENSLCGIPVVVTNQNTTELYLLNSEIPDTKQYYKIIAYGKIKTSFINLADERNIYVCVPVNNRATTNPAYPIYITWFYYFQTNAMGISVVSQ